MVKVLKVLFVVAVVATLSVSAFAQNANPYNYLNGVDYFFFNINVPPKNGDIAYLCFPSACLYGSSSSPATEGAAPHGEAVQDEGFVLWNGQAGTAPGTSAPLGFSLILFRTQQGTCVLQGAVPTCGLSGGASWSTSLPCAAPWFWIVTFTWSTPLTLPTCANPKPGSVAGGNLIVGVAGELNQTVANQNYFTGSGNERNLNAGGISFFFDGTSSGVFQLVGAQEWSHRLFTRDAVARTGRHPSATAAAPKVLDFGTGGFTLRQAGSKYGAGDAGKFRTYDFQDTGGIVIDLITCGFFGDFITPNAGFPVPGTDPRAFDIVTDPCTSISLSVGIFKAALVGGIADTIIEVPIPPLGGSIIPIVYQALDVNIPLGAFGALSSTGTVTIL
jgi:hypothetical protein